MAKHATIVLPGEETSFDFPGKGDPKSEETQSLFGPMKEKPPIEPEISTRSPVYTPAPGAVTCTGFPPVALRMMGGPSPRAGSREPEIFPGSCRVKVDVTAIVAGCFSVSPALEEKAHVSITY